MTLPNGSWSMSTTFLGFTLVQAEGKTVTLSDSEQTVVDVLINAGGPGPGPYASGTFAISGGFQVCDPDTGDASDIGALVATSGSMPGNLTGWWVHLIFPPQAGSPTVVVNGWAYFAVYSGGTFS